MFERMDVRVVDHPVAAARLTTLRDERTDNAAFRAALCDLTLMLVYEATRDAATEPVSIRTPMAATMGSRLAAPPLLVPVLRAGLGMVDRAHIIIPEAKVGFGAVERDEKKKHATKHYEKLVVWAHEGMGVLEDVAPDLRLFTAASHGGLNDIAYIVPGLGDAGDRQFGPR